MFKELKLHKIYHANTIVTVRAQSLPPWCRCGGNTARHRMTLLCASF